MIDLPISPAPARYKVTAIDFGATLTPPLGGADQRINRPGSKFSVEFTMPPMFNKEEGRLFTTRLMRGQRQGARLPFPLGGIEPGVASTQVTPKLFGAAQTGTTINLYHFVGGYQVQEGQPFSIEDAAGNHYLHFAAETRTAQANGTMSLLIEPGIREIFPTATACHFEEPMIQGLCEGDAKEWDVSVEKILGIVFTIRERK